MKDKYNKKPRHTRHLDLSTQNPSSNSFRKLLFKQFETPIESGLTLPKVLQQSKNIVKYYSAIIQLDKKINVSSIN